MNQQMKKTLMRRMQMLTIKDMKDKVVLAFKYWYYTTLTEENIDKIIKRKEEELRNFRTPDLW